MQKYEDICVIFQSSGCAGAHPHDTLDPPLSVVALAWVSCS